MANEQQNGGFWQGNDDTMSEEDAARVLAGGAIETNPDPAVIPAEPETDHVVEEVYEEVAHASTEEDEDSEYAKKIMGDARLRLEQGRLYEMLLEHSLFSDVNAAPEAVANVEKEIKRFIRERLEVLLGIRPDPRLAPAAPAQVMGQFTQFEVDVLRKLVSRASGGVSERLGQTPAPATIPVAPAKSGAIRPLGAKFDIDSLGSPQKTSGTRPSAVKVVPKAPRAPATPARAPAKAIAATTAPLATPPAQGTPTMIVNLEGGQKAIIPAEAEAGLPMAAHKMKRSDIAERSRRIAERHQRHKAQVPGPGHMPTIPLDQANAMTTMAVVNRTANSQGSLANGIPLMPLVNTIIAKKLSQE